MIREDSGSINNNRNLILQRDIQMSQTTTPQPEVEELDFDHLDPSSRLSIMEKKYKVVEDHTVTVSKLSTKVSLLLTIMSFAVIIVSGAAVYTFTGLDKFKDVYNEDRIGVHQLINETQISNRKLIQDSIDALESSLDTRIDDIEDNMDERMDSIEKQYIELKTKIKEK